MAATELRNTWGMAAWSPKFGALLHECVQDRPDGTLVLGEIFNEALSRGLRSRAAWFEHGSFIDVGTAKGLFTLTDRAPAAAATRRQVAIG